MTVVIRARNFQTNKLLSRRQMILDVIHPEQANVSRSKLQELVATKFKVEKRNVVLFGFHTNFGGGRTTGFCLLYDSHQYLLKYEPRYRLMRAGIVQKKQVGRKACKEIKGKCLRTRGIEVNKIKGTKLRSAFDLAQMKANYLKTASA